MAGRRYHFVINERSGTAQKLGLTTESMRQRLSDAGIECRIEGVTEDTPFSECERAVRASDADTIVAVGGDGTFTGLVQAAMDSGKTLAFLPMGTFNLMAHDLGLPLDLDEWIAALPEMTERRIDVCDVNGQVFMHKVVLGLMPEVMKARERIRGHESPQTIAALINYFFRRVSRLRRIPIVIDEKGGATRVMKVAAIAVSNNPYAEGIGQYLARETLDAGKLVLYVARKFTIADAVMLVGGMMIGKWRYISDIDIEEVSDITVKRWKKRHKVMLDGDVVSLDGPLHFRIQPRALRVLAPPAAETASDTATVSEPGLETAVAQTG